MIGKGALSATPSHLEVRPHAMSANDNSEPLKGKN
jgi:hypothetical protein